MASSSFRAPLLWLLIPIIGGYMAGHHLPTLSPWVTIIAAGLLLGVSIRFVSPRSKHEKPWAIIFLFGVFTASLLYYQQSRTFPQLWEELPAREANLTIKVKRLYTSNDPQLSKGIAEIVSTETHLKALSGYPIFFSIETEDFLIYRGQFLQTSGVLNYLPAKDHLTIFEEYLLGQSIPLIINRAVLRTTPKDGTSVEKFINQLRQKAIRTLGIEIEGYQEELSIYRGMMLGIKGGLSDENKELFLKTGTLHLFAISGLHVGIIAVSLAGIFIVFRIPKRISVALGLIMVYLYVELTGASPSAVRAFAMIAFFWLGKSLVRQTPPFQALVASAVVVLLVSPSQLFSAGFQLSYTVVTGILIWGIPLYQTLRERRQNRILEKEKYQHRLSKYLNKVWELTVGTFCISLSATLASAPLSILYFGLLAPFAIFLNMLLVPTASLVIIAGLFSLISGFAYLPFLAAFFNHGPILLISIMESLLEKIVVLPAAFLTMTWVWDGLGFLTVFLFMGGLITGHSLKFPKPLLFCFPVVLTAGMILLNSLIQFL